MATNDDTQSTEDVREGPTNGRVRSMIRKRRHDGSLALLAGTAMLAWAARTLRSSRSKAGLQALAGLTLLGTGRRQRRTQRREERIETGADAERTDSGDKAASDHAHTEAEHDLGAGRVADESASVYQSENEPNPRGMTDREDVEGDDGGDIDFVDGKEPGNHRETEIEGDRDTRLQSEGDEAVEIDISESAMADEASEAAGPQTEQAYPAQEGTDPEPTAEQAPERVTDGDDRGSDDPAADTNGGSTDDESATHDNEE